MSLQDNKFMQYAKCKELEDTNFFFAEDPRGTREAVRYCKDCPVKDPCGQYAMDNNIFYGVWGGLSIRARFKLKRQQKLLQTV